MREVTIGGVTIPIVASPITLFVYKREFGCDLMGSLASFPEIQDVAARDLSKFDASALLQMAWAMAKTAATGTPFPNFAQWLGQLEFVDLDDTGMYMAIVEEIKRGFFRGGRASGAQAAVDTSQQ